MRRRMLSSWHISTIASDRRRDESNMTSFRTARVEGLNVFYREAGDPANPRLLLLGGFPASSHQFRNLIPALAERFHVVSPDYPGFGNSDMPDPTTWSYTFDHLAEVVDELLIEFLSPLSLEDHAS